MPYVDATGARLYFEENGQGYPIIFVHEFGSDSRQWEAQVRYFSRSYRCITYNARGYPPSDVPEDAALYGWEFSVDDIAAVMRGLAIERAHVVGLSMGGYAALQFGLRYPEEVSAIVAAAVGSGSLPSQARRVAEGNVCSLADLYRARNARDGREDVAWSGPHPAKAQGPEKLGRFRRTFASTFGARNVEYDGTLPGFAAVFA